MTKLQVIIGSSRTARNGKTIAEWVYEAAQKHDGAEVELVDLAEWKLPMFDEATPPMMGRRDSDVSKKWSEKIAEADGYIMVTPEYNHSFPASLKNALDYLFAEWSGKPVATVGYGFSGGSMAIEGLKPVFENLQLESIEPAVNVVFTGANMGPQGLVGFDELAAANQATLEDAIANVVRAAEAFRKTKEQA